MGKGDGRFGSGIGCGSREAELDFRDFGWRCRSRVWGRGGRGTGIASGMRSGSESG